MLVDDIILGGRKLKSFINKLEPAFLKTLIPNAIRSKELLETATTEISEVNLDSFVLLIRYYNTLSSDYRDKLKKSLELDIDIPNTAKIELVEYGSLSETNKIIFEMIYTLSLLDGHSEI
jgi:hypothetical protein